MKRIATLALGLAIAGVANAQGLQVAKDNPQTLVNSVRAQEVKSNTTSVSCMPSQAIDLLRLEGSITHHIRTDARVTILGAEMRASLIKGGAVIGVDFLPLVTNEYVGRDLLFGYRQRTYAQAQRIDCGELGVMADSIEFVAVFYLQNNNTSQQTVDVGLNSLTE